MQRYLKFIFWNEKVFCFKKINRKIEVHKRKTPRDEFCWFLLRQRSTQYIISRVVLFENWVCKSFAENC